MTSTVFTPGTLIESTWLNDVNAKVYAPPTPPVIPTAIEIPFTPSLNIASTNVQDAIQEVRDDITGGGGGGASVNNVVVNGRMIVQRAYWPDEIVVNTPMFGGASHIVTTVNATTVIDGLVELLRVGGGWPDVIPTSSGFAHGTKFLRTTGTTEVSFKTRCEGFTTVPLSEGSVTIQMKVYQNTGAPLAHHLSLYQPTSYDDFASPLEQIGSDYVSNNIASGVWTTVYTTYALTDIDALNGLEIRSTWPGVPALSSETSFCIGDIQLESGAVANPIEIKGLGIDELQCDKYYQVRQANVFLAKSTTAITSAIQFSPVMYKVPTGSLNPLLGGVQVTNGVNDFSPAPIAINYIGYTGGGDYIEIEITGYTGLTAKQTYYMKNAPILFDAEMQ